MNRRRIQAIAIAVAVTMWCAPTVSAQNAAAPFQIVETSIDDVHAAFRSGKLTAHQLVQGYLDRIDAYDKRGPAINSVITLKSGKRWKKPTDWMRSSRRTGDFVGSLHGIPVLVKDRDGYRGGCRPPSGSLVVRRTTGRPGTASGRGEAQEGGGDHSRQNDVGRMGGWRHLRIDVRRHAQSVRPGSHGRRLIGRPRRRSSRRTSRTITLGEEGFASIRRPSALE